MPTNTKTTPITPNITTQKLDTQATYEALRDGLDTLMPKTDPFVIAKRTIPRATVMALIQSAIDACKKTKDDRITLSSSVAAEHDALAQVKPVRDGIKLLAQSQFGKTAPELQKLGFVQNRRPRRNAAAKAAGVAKREATREARGTKGRQQAAAIPAPAEQPTAPPAPPSPPALRRPRRPTARRRPERTPRRPSGTAAGPASEACDAGPAGPSATRSHTASAHKRERRPGVASGAPLACSRRALLTGSPWGTRGSAGTRD